MRARVESHYERYRRLVESCPDGIFVARNARIAFVNPAGASLAGASTVDRLIGTDPLSLFQHDQRLQIQDAFSRAAHGQTPITTEATLARLDGKPAPVDVTVVPFADDQGPALQIVLRDISARKQTETALRESEERLTLAFAGAREGVWDWNLETGAVVYSPRWKQMLGYTDDEIEPHVRAWEQLLHPDDRPRAAELTETLARGGDTYEGEFRLRHKEGHFIHVLSRGFPIRRAQDNRVVRIVGTHLDITERKRIETALRESEERLTLAFAGAQEGVWDWNLETGAVLYSPRWKQMLGYADNEIEPHVGAWERLLHPEDKPRAEQLNESVIRGGGQIYEGEFRLRHKAGHFIHVLSRGFPVRREPGGPVVRIVGTHFDLTERQRVESARARTELLARLVFAQEDERRRIAREMHDQFGEHLTALGLGIAALKAACGEQPDLRSRVDGLESVAQRLDREVEHLVWALRPTALDDLGLRAALANYVQDWSARSGVAAELHTVGLLDRRLMSEVETTLYRIAQEALTNVAKHAHANKVDIILERRDDTVFLIVEDDGVGFDPAETGSAGRGFGLLGMQERATLVGASLQIESAVGKGTTIFVRVAATRGDAADNG
jgi:PAS domain S-box-containing protein